MEQSKNSIGIADLLSKICVLSERVGKERSRRQLPSGNEEISGRAKGGREEIWGSIYEKLPPHSSLLLQQRRTPNRKMGSSSDPDTRPYCHTNSSFCPVPARREPASGGMRFHARITTERFFNQSVSPFPSHPGERLRYELPSQANHNTATPAPLRRLQSPTATTGQKKNPGNRRPHQTLPGFSDRDSHISQDHRHLTKHVHDEHASQGSGHAKGKRDPTRVRRTLPSTSVNALPYGDPRNSNGQKESSATDSVSF